MGLCVLFFRPLLFVEPEGRCRANESRLPYLLPWVWEGTALPSLTGCTA